VNRYTQTGAYSARQKWRQDDHAALQIRKNAAGQAERLFQLLAIGDLTEDLCLLF